MSDVAQLMTDPPAAVRLFFVTTDGLHRPFLHFRGRGDDIYWGPPGRGAVHSNIVERTGTELRITVDDQQRSDASVKASYHRSGQVHVKVDDEMTADGPLRQPAPEMLSSPIRAGWVVSKPPIEYAAYRKQVPTASAAFIRLDCRRP
jgi:hypothetical protein